MEDNNNKLEDFLRKKLTDLSEPHEAWDKPDSEVWLHAQSQMGTSSSSKKPRASAFLIGGLALLLLLSIACHIQSSKKTISLKEELVSTQHKIQVAYKKEKVSQQKIQEAYKTKTNLSQLVSSQQIIISDLTRSNQLLQHKLNQRVSASKKHIPKSSKAYATIDSQKELNPKVFENDILAPKSKFLSTHSVFSQKKLLPEFISLPLALKKRNRFETGYSLTWQRISIPSISNFKDLSSTSDNLKNNETHSYAHGFSFSFSPKRNFYIRTGIRKSNMVFSQDFKFGLAYDKSKEYTHSNGKTVNDLEFNQSTPFTDEKSNIGIEVPQGGGLESGDLLVVSLYEFQEATYFQIPIGIDYFHGNGRLQWNVQGGIQWNKMVLGDYSLKTKVEAKAKDIPILKTETFPKEDRSKQFMGTYAGLGLDFRIIGDWHARTSLTYNFHFINDLQNTFSNSQLIERNINLGIHYRF